MHPFIPMAKDNPRGMHPKARAWVFDLDPHSLRPVDIRWLFGKEGTDEPTIKDLHDLLYKSLWVWNRQITIPWDHAQGDPDDERQQHRLLDIKALVRDDLSRVTQDLSPYLRRNLTIRFELKGWNFYSWFVRGTREFHLDEINDSPELQALFKFGYELPDPDRGPIDDRPAPPIT